MIHEAAAFVHTSELAMWPEVRKQVKSKTEIIIHVSLLASENGF